MMAWADLMCAGLAACIMTGPALAEDMDESPAVQTASASPGGSNGDGDGW
jgi:coenzyme F420-reducing hydrogenase gamma subunit